MPKVKFRNYHLALLLFDIVHRCCSQGYWSNEVTSVDCNHPTACNGIAVGLNGRYVCSGRIANTHIGWMQSGSGCHTYHTLVPDSSFKCLCHGDPLYTWVRAMGGSDDLGDCHTKCAPHGQGATADLNNMVWICAATVGGFTFLGRVQDSKPLECDYNNGTATIVPTKDADTKDCLCLGTERYVPTTTAEPVSTTPPPRVKKSSKQFQLIAEGMIPASGTPLGQIPKPVSCAMACFTADQCEGFAYSMNTKQCMAYNEVEMMGGATQLGTGFKTFN